LFVFCAMYNKKSSIYSAALRSIVSVKYPKQLETTIAAAPATCNFSFSLARTASPPACQFASLPVFQALAAQPAQPVQLSRHLALLAREYGISFCRSLFPFPFCLPPATHVFTTQQHRNNCKCILGLMPQAKTWGMQLSRGGTRFINLLNILPVSTFGKVLLSHFFYSFLFFCQLFTLHPLPLRVGPIVK